MTFDDGAFTRALHAAVEDPPVPADLASRVARAHGRRRRRLAVAGGVGAVLAVVATLAIPVVVRRAEPVTPATPSGPLVAANGAVVVRPGQPLRFCEIRYRVDTGRAAMQPPPCWNVVDATGIDYGPLTQRVGELDGTRWADVWVRGVYAGGTLHVVEQSSAWRFPAEPPHVNPCPSASPAPGSADTLDQTAAEHWQTAHPGDAVGVTSVSLDGPGRRGVVVVGAVHPAVVEAALRPVYGATLCVVESRYTPAEIAAARADAAAFVGAKGYTDGLPHAQLDVTEEFGADGQAHVRVHVAVTDAAAEALAARHPAGLVRIDPWLAPATG